MKVVIQRVIQASVTIQQQLHASIGRGMMTGVFGADMQVGLINDGPVTIIIDSKNRL